MKKITLKNIYCFLNGFRIFKSKQRIYVRGNIFLDRRLKVTLGRGIRIYSFLNKVSFFGHGDLILGENVFINNGTVFECRDRIIIGDNTKIAYDCLIIDAENHSVDGITAPRYRSIHIGKNVWIGAKSIILPGVIIGDNSVICAGSVVNKEVLKNTLVGGVPAKVIRNSIYKNGEIPRK